MTDVFFTVVKMDVYGLIAAWIVMIALLILGRTRVSKTALLALWLVVGFRLVCPWSPPSPISLFNWDLASKVAQDSSRLENVYVGDVQAAVAFLDGDHADFDRAVAAGARPELDDGIHMQVAYYYQDEAGNITPARTFREAYGGIAANLWLAVAAALLVYSGVSYLLLKRKLRFAVRDEERPGVWYSDRIPSPCVAGLFKPQIYLTFGMTEEERDYVLTHERQHIKNGDHVWKMLGWLILCVHWFDPLMWPLWAEFLSTLEAACDQRVLRELGEGKKADYGQALLSLSSEKRFRPGFSPLAFGEGDTKERVKTVLKYKTPLAWLTAVAAIAAAVVGVSVLTSRAEREADAPAGETVAWTYKPLSSNSYELAFPFSFTFTSECDRLEFSCENGELLVDAHVHAKAVVREGQPYETVYWSPAGDDPLAAAEDTLTFKVYRQEDEVGSGTIRITQTGSEGDAYIYTACAVLSDSEHYYFEAGDPEQGGASIGGGPDWWPPFTFTAVVTASDPDLGVLTVEPEQDLLDGFSRFQFEFWEPSEYHAGDRVLVTARHIITGPDGQTEEGAGSFGQVDDAIPLSNEMAEWRVDLTHDGADERVYVTGSGDGVFYLVVENAAGNVLWTDRAATAHAGQNGLYLYKGDDGQSYLLNWVPYMVSGVCDYRYRLFSLSEAGEERTVLQGSVEPDWNDVWGADPAELRAFEKEIDGLLDKSVVLLSTNGDTPQGVYYGSAEGPVIPIGPWDSGAEYFEGLQALAQGTYTFTGEVVSVQEDRVMVADQSLWTGAGLRSYVFSIPTDAAGDVAEGDMVTVTADGPLYRWRMPDEGTRVTVSPVSNRVHPISG